MSDTNTKLRKEKSINSSGVLINETKIQLLKEANYFVIDRPLGGDAPKEFIKAYFYMADRKGHKKNRKTWIPYIAKTGEKWYPHESVIEYLINRIGNELEINMNSTRLVIANDQIRFLSEYFLEKDERLIHGAEILGEHLQDQNFARKIANDKKDSRILFTFEFIEEAIKSQFPDQAAQILNEIVKMITFDAVAGNNDRHFYNWGVITNTKRINQAPRFSPLYDSARGLLWNHSNENLVDTYKSHCDCGKKIVNYIQKASPRISIEGNNNVNHFDLIGFLKEYDSHKYLHIIDQISTKERQSQVLQMIERDFSKFFTVERSKLISFILNQRFQKVREA